MIRARLMSLALLDDRTFFLFLLRPAGNFMEAQQGAVMTYLHSPVDQFLNHDLLCLYPVLYLVEFFVMLNRVIILDGP